VLPKLSHPIVGCVGFCFFGLGCFPAFVAVGQVGLFLVNQHGAMLAWVGREQNAMLATLFFRVVGILFESAILTRDSLRIR
jgi:hypothetical protein